MSCNCTNIACLQVVFDPCSEGAQINEIIADETGNWTGEIEFAGAYTGFSFGVIDGEKIVIPAELLNENYVHDLKLFKVDGTLLNDTCYQFSARAVKNSGSFPVIPGEGVPDPIKIIIVDAGNSFTDERLVGKTVSHIVSDDSSYTSTKWDKPIISDTLTSKNDPDGNPYLNFYLGQIIIVNFLKNV